METSGLSAYCQQQIILLDAQANRIKQRQGESLYKSLMVDMKLYASQKIEQQEALMKCLETWWDHNPLVASYLMARLLPEAAKVIGNHTLCDAIELYLTSTESPEITHALQIILEEEITPNYRKKYHNYLTNNAPNEM